MEKAPRIHFTGKGPFSSINAFTTRIGMIQAAHVFGLGGNALVSTIDNSEDPEFVEGVLNYHKIAEDPNYGSK